MSGPNKVSYLRSPSKATDIRAFATRALRRQPFLAVQVAAALRTEQALAALEPGVGRQEWPLAVSARHSESAFGHEVKQDPGWSLAGR